MEQSIDTKQRLKDELTEVTEELRAIGIEDPATHDWVAVPETAGTNEPDPNLNADTTEEWNERRAVLSQLETRFRNLSLALEKIEAGTYGTCEVCHGPIEAERLSVHPAARTCTQHMEQEKKLPLT